MKWIADRLQRAGQQRALADEPGANSVNGERIDTDRYEPMVAKCKAAGRPISQFDHQIAVIARTHSASLASRNPKRNAGGYE